MTESSQGLASRDELFAGGAAFVGSGETVVTAFDVGFRDCVGEEEEEEDSIEADDEDEDMASSPDELIIEETVSLCVLARLVSIALAVTVASSGAVVTSVNVLPREVEPVRSSLLFSLSTCLLLAVTVTVATWTMVVVVVPLVIVGMSGGAVKEGDKVSSASLGIVNMTKVSSSLGSKLSEHSIASSRPSSQAGWLSRLLVVICDCKGEEDMGITRSAEKS